MNLPEMPELPEPDWRLGPFADGGQPPAWAAYRLRAYGKLCLELGYKMGREDAAKEVETMCEGQFARIGQDLAAAIRGEKG